MGQLRGRIPDSSLHLMISVLVVVVILNSSIPHRHFAAAATQLQILWMLQSQLDSFLHRIVFVTAKTRAFAVLFLNQMKGCNLKILSFLKAVNHLEDF
jgi:hypothetical protein